MLENEDILLQLSYYSYIDKILEDAMYKRPNFRHKICNGNYTCGIFVAFQNPFDKVDHHIRLKTVGYYGFRAIINKCFGFYLRNKAAVCFNK